MQNSKEYLDSLVEDLGRCGVTATPSTYAQGNCVLNEDRDLKIIVEMEKTLGIEYSEEQKKILRHKGNACILACAGSGKTTTSVHLIAKRIASGEIVNTDKMIYTTFSKAGATEMKQRLDIILRKMGINRKVQVRTLHSLFLSLLRTFGVNSGIIKEYQRTKFIKEACKEANFTVKDDDLMLIDNLLSYQVNNLLSDKKTVESYVNTIKELTVDIYSKIRVGYANKKASQGLIDYDDMQSYLYLWLVKFGKSSKPEENQVAKSVRDYCKAMWTDFYIDEAQDVSKIQFAIIREMVTDPNDDRKLDRNFVFIGDDDQAIYEWRGSDPSIIISIGAMFDIQTFVLSTNYRCKSSITDYATVGVKNNRGRYNKGMSGKEPGGEVLIHCADKDGLCELSEIARDHIKWLISNGTDPKDIAVLARNNLHLAVLNVMLIKEGIYCDISDDMKLTKSYVYKDVVKLIEISSDSWKAEITSSMLWKMCRYLPSAVAKVVAEFQEASGLSLKDTLGYILQNACHRDLGFKKDVKVSLQMFEKLKYHFAAIKNDTIQVMITLYGWIGECADVMALQEIMRIYIENSSYLHKSADSDRTVRGICNFMVKFARQEGVDKLKEFLRVVEQFEDGNMGTIGNKVTFTTIHSAKGREWKNVIMFACDNISQPNFGSILNMINTSADDSDITRYIDEERRLCYVGNTRAKENLFILSGKMPSIFVLEALGVFDNQSVKEDEEEMLANDRVIALAQDSRALGDLGSLVDKYIKDPSSKHYYDVNVHKCEG